MAPRPTIQQPCPADWEQMTPVTGGRYCGSCQKVVVDFTRMSEAEVVAWLGRNGRTCGRFRTEQLAEAPTLNRWAAVAATAAAVALSACESPQPRHTTGVIMPEVYTTIPLPTLLVRGQVLDAATHQPLAGATITSQADSAYQTHSQPDGCFELLLPQTLADSLLVVAGPAGYLARTVCPAPVLPVELRPIPTDVLGAVQLRPDELRIPAQVTTVQFVPPPAPAIE